MTDESGQDAKVLAVPEDHLCYDYRGVTEYVQLPDMLRAQIAHFFDHYKDLELNKWVDIDGWEDASAAKLEIMESVARFHEALEAKSL